MERSRIEAFAGKARNLLKSQISARIDLLRKSESSAVVIESKNAMAALEKRIAKIGLESVIDEVSYTWFNRLCALRYMDVHDFNRPLVVTPPDGNVLPEILSDAMTGNLDTEILTKANEDRINKLLSGEIRSGNAQAEIYRILLVARCNSLNKDIPMLFERISDYTDLLLPEDLLSKGAIIPMMREALTDENCETVEVIGWLYQYYIAEKKDEVFASFKKGKKATSKEIPAATQLFTPEWIVRYLVENSLGRLWMLNHPESRLIEKMEYYIKPVDVEPDFIRISSPEEIKVCDPCCGSGHMLTYSFDILYEIYSELGYTSKDAVEHIIRDNLYGIEIDDRAGQLAYFALMMKAREKARRFFTLGVEPNICVLHNVVFDEEELHVACGLFSNTKDSVVKELLSPFEHADTFGSLIVPCIDDVEKLKCNLTKTVRTDDLFDVTDTVELRVAEVLKYAEFLSSRYQVVITNPPYMGNYDDVMKPWITKNYPISKTDLCTAFMERDWTLCVKHGYSAMVNMQSWMFLTSFTKLREKVIKERTIISMAHIGARGFDSIGGEVVSTTAFITSNYTSSVYTSDVRRLVKGVGEREKIKLFFDEQCKYLIDFHELKGIPGTPLSYWIDKRVLYAFRMWNKVDGIGHPSTGMMTANNEFFLRLWYEIPYPEMSDKAKYRNKWIIYLKGGSFRRWYGNLEYVLHYNNNPNFVLSQKNATIMPISALQSIKGTWTDITSGKNSFRYAPKESFHDLSGHCIYPDEKDLNFLLGYLNSSMFNYCKNLINQTFHCQVGDVARVPIPPISNADRNYVEELAEDSIGLSKSDWNSFEVSWDFKHHPFVHSFKGLCDITATTAAIDNYYGETKKSSCPLEKCFLLWQSECNERFNRLKANEEELNRIFIDIYGLQDEFTPEEDDSDVSVRKADLNRDMRSFVSYAVGCALGRYSLDVEGLAYAGGAWDSTKYTSFIPDEDNVIPVLSDEWFSDDITSRFREFVKVVFGEETLAANMKYVEDALGMSIRNYFTKEFYKDHLKIYQKRPIYWMFSSPKGYFNALVYLHRYNENTSSVVLSYLRKLRGKLATEIGALERENNSKNAKKLVNYRKMAEDLDDYERILYPIAMENIVLDLDDGVKANYAKLGEALKKVPGLEKAE